MLLPRATVAFQTINVAFLCLIDCLNQRSPFTFIQNDWAKQPPVPAPSLPSLPRHEAPTLAPMLFQQRDAGHGHAPVYRFAHVINGEQGDLHGYINQQLS